MLTADEAGLDEIAWTKLIEMLKLVKSSPSTQRAARRKAGEVRAIIGLAAFEAPKLPDLDAVGDESDPTPPKRKRARRPSKRSRESD